MAQYQITLDELGNKVQEYVKTKCADVVKAIQLSAQVSCPRIIQEVIDSTDPYPPVDRGTYRRNWHVAKTSDGAVIYNPTKYAGIIEDGRRPGTGIGKSGIQALTEWVRRHGMASGTKGGDNAKSIAFAIAHAIMARGLAAKKILERSKPLMLAEIRADIERVITTGTF